MCIGIKSTAGFSKLRRVDVFLHFTYVLFKEMHVFNCFVVNSVLEAKIKKEQLKNYFSDSKLANIDR